jgi:TPR repeat protein
MMTLYIADPALEHLHPQSLAEEGFMWFHGNGATRNLGKAFCAWEKAAATDNAAALYGLGMLYEHGLGVTRDFARALEYFECAAGQGHLSARIGVARVRRQLADKVVGAGQGE